MSWIYGSPYPHLAREGKGVVGYLAGVIKISRWMRSTAVCVRIPARRFGRGPRSAPRGEAGSGPTGALRQTCGSGRDPLAHAW